jgi:hypothetical protein
MSGRGPDALQQEHFVESFQARQSVFVIRHILRASQRRRNSLARNG